MKHEWVRFAGWNDLGFNLEANQKSSVHVCSRCRSIAFSEVGGEADESTNPSLKDCDEEIADQIMKS